jgi:hypothetical protein
MKRYWAILACTAVGALALIAATTARDVTMHPHAQPMTVPVVRTGSGTDLTPLTAMTAALATTGHDVTMRTAASTMKASVDPATHTSMAAVSNGTIEIDEVVSHGKVFVRVNFGVALDRQLGIQPYAWMAMDPSKINSDNALLIQPNGAEPVDLAGISKGITSLTRTDAQHLTGTIDLTKVTGHTVPNPAEVAKAGHPATEVPIAIRADGQGRISEFTVRADGFDPTLSLDVLYSDYGSPSTIEVPSGSPAAPDLLYSVFNN